MFICSDRIGTVRATGFWSCLRNATDDEREAFKLANKGGLTEGFFPDQGRGDL